VSETQGLNGIARRLLAASNRHCWFSEQSLSPAQTRLNSAVFESEAQPEPAADSKAIPLETRNAPTGQRDVMAWHVASPDPAPMLTFTRGFRVMSTGVGVPV
jgi:hypothetical protein